MKKIPLIRPYITEEIKSAVMAVLDSGYLTEGPVTHALEQSVAQYVDCPHALAVCNCTVGLEVALRALGIGPGDEVIVPDYTYPATADVVSIVGAQIVLVDVAPETMLIDYDQLEAAITPQTKAVIPVSGFGNPLNYDRLNAIKAKYGVFIIEDAACSLGAEYNGVKVGSLADISVFSLHPRKFITTGEGGIITTRDNAMADWMMSYKHFGLGAHQSRLTSTFERIGTNYKLSNILAAVGLAQMESISERLSRRLSLADNYKQLLVDHPAIQLPQTTPGGKHSMQSFCVFIENRDAVMQTLRERGIEVQIGTYALHMHPAFAQQPEHCRWTGRLKNSRFVFEHCLTLPLYHEMRASDQEYVVNQLCHLL